jgi:hypothetical protein
MPYLETVDQALPIGLNFDGRWFNIAVVREQIASDTKLLSSAEAKNNPVKGITSFLETIILGFKNTHNGDTLDRVSKEAVQNMFIADRDMSILASRKLSFGDEINIGFICPNPDCNEQVTFDFDLNTIPIKFLDDDESFPPNIEKSVHLKKGVRVGNSDETYKTFILTHLRGRDQEKIQQMTRTNMAQGANATLYMALKDVPGFDPTRRSPALIDNLKAVDLQILLTEFENMQAGPKLQADVKCENCGRATNIPLAQKMLSFSA